MITPTMISNNEGSGIYDADTGEMLFIGSVGTNGDFRGSPICGYRHVSTIGQPYEIPWPLMMLPGNGAIAGASLPSPGMEPTADYPAFFPHEPAVTMEGSVSATTDWLMPDLGNAAPPTPGYMVVADVSITDVNPYTYPDDVPWAPIAVSPIYTGWIALAVETMMVGTPPDVLIKYKFSLSGSFSGYIPQKGNISPASLHVYTQLTYNEQWDPQWISHDFQCSATVQ
jgi:hypothetical protein